MKVLLTRSREHIGTVPLLVRAGHDVVDVDTDLVSIGSVHLPKVH